MRPSIKLGRNLAFGVPDKERATAFYRDVIGMSVEQKADSYVGLNGGPMTIYVCEDDVQVPAFELVVEDVQAATQFLLENGCTLAPDIHPGEVFVRDPFGYLFNVYKPSDE